MIGNRSHINLKNNQKEREVIINERIYLCDYR